MLRPVALATILTGCLWPALAQTAPPAADPPRNVVAALYAREIAEMKKASPETSFTTPKVRARYFSKSFDGLVTRAEAKSAKEQEPGPVDFDPVISGQDGEIKKLKVETDRIQGGKAVVSARFASFGHPTLVVYDLVEEGGGWKIDDIRGKAGTQPWSIRKILEEAEGRK